MKAMNEMRGARLGDPPMKVWILDRREPLALKLMLVLHCDAARSRGRQSCKTWIPSHGKHGPKFGGELP
jgi:hypothetical protein